MRLQMNRGTDSIGHDGMNYVVDPVTWQVEVPDHVGVVTLATGAGAVRIDDDTEPEDFVAMRHPRNPLQPLTARGRTYHPEDGKVHVHAVCVADAIRAGFVLVEV